jgi:hypothetical protein
MTSQARLDYILGTAEVSENCTGAAIAKDDLDTDSDHCPVFMEMHTLDMSTRIPRGPAAPRLLYDFATTSEDDWKVYKSMTAALPERLKSELELLESGEPTGYQRGITSCWNLLVDHLKDSARAAIPWHMVRKRAQGAAFSKEGVVIKSIGAILCQWTSPTTDHSLVQRRLDKLRSLLPEEELLGLDAADSKEEFQRSLRHSYRNAIRLRATSDNTARRAFFIQRRMEDLKDNMSRMIDSIMERKRPDSTINLVKKPDGELVGDPASVRLLVRDYFERRFRHRRWARSRPPLQAARTASPTARASCQASSSSTWTTLSWPR